VWVVHYDEIGIKGRNRGFFEGRLADNLRACLAPMAANVGRLRGRLVVQTDASDPVVEDRLASVPGVAYFAPVVRTSLEIEAIRDAAVRLAGDADDASTFGIATRRSNKSFPLASPAINILVGQAVRDATGLAVDLDAPDVLIRIDITERHAFLFSRRVEGLGGLPVGVSGAVIALLSGGIDSPVAAFKAMRRGCRVILLHFHNHHRDAAGVRSKLLDLATVLARFQKRVRLYVVPFADLQAAIIAAVPAAARMVAYRRAMLRLGETILEREKALGFVTGDALGQVASQTLYNLATIQAATRRPILAPLIAEDKNEIVALARRIGTYDISIRPYDDCCAYLVADHPDTKVRLEQLEAWEANIPYDDLAERTLDAMEVHDVGRQAPR